MEFLQTAKNVIWWRSNHTAPKFYILGPNSLQFTPQIVPLIPNSTKTMIFLLIRLRFWLQTTEKNWPGTVKKIIPNHKIFAYFSKLQKWPFSAFCSLEAKQIFLAVCTKFSNCKSRTAHGKTLPANILRRVPHHHASGRISDRSSRAGNAETKDPWNIGRGRKDFLKPCF